MRLHAYATLYDCAQLPSLRIPIPDTDGTAFLTVCGVDISDYADGLAPGDTVQHALDCDGTSCDTYDDPTSLAHDLLARSFPNQCAGAVLHYNGTHYLLTIYYAAP